MKFNKILILFALMLLANYQMKIYKNIEKYFISNYQHVSFDDLRKNPQIFNKKYVLFKGSLREEYEDFSLHRSNNNSDLIYLFRTNKLVYKSYNFSLWKDFFCLFEKFFGQYQFDFPLFGYDDVILVGKYYCSNADKNLGHSGTNDDIVDIIFVSNIANTEYKPVNFEPVFWYTNQFIILAILFFANILDIGFYLLIYMLINTFGEDLILKLPVTFNNNLIWVYSSNYSQILYFCLIFVKTLIYIKVIQIAICKLFNQQNQKKKLSIKNIIFSIKNNKLEAVTSYCVFYFVFFIFILPKIQNYNFNTLIDTMNKMDLNLMPINFLIILITILGSLILFVISKLTNVLNYFKLIKTKFKFNFQAVIICVVLYLILPSPSALLIYLFLLFCFHVIIIMLNKLFKNNSYDYKINNFKSLIKQIISRTDVLTAVCLCYPLTYFPQTVSLITDNYYKIFQVFHVDVKNMSHHKIIGGKIEYCQNYLIPELKPGQDNDFVFDIANNEEYEYKLLKITIKFDDNKELSDEFFRINHYETKENKNYYNKILVITDDKITDELRP